MSNKTLMIRKILLGAAFTAFVGVANSQLVIDNAVLFIENGATVTVQGDVTSNVAIQAAGTGKIQMKGTALQTINMNGNTIPNLEIDNATHVQLGTGNAKVTGALTFTNGKLILGANNLLLGSASTFTGVGASKFAETNGAGSVIRDVAAAGTFILPTGNGTNYNPLTYTLTGGAYGASSTVSARSAGSAHPQKHIRSTDFLNNYWSLANANLGGATISATGAYVDPSGVTGTDPNVDAFVWNGTNWTAGTSNDDAANTATASIGAGTQELYAMNKYVLASPKVFLQGANPTGSPLLMSDLLRTNVAYVPNTLPASNLLPTADPYATPTYSTGAVRALDSDPTSVTSTAVFNDLSIADNQIVDWVFVELRNITSASTSTLIQTRSGLLQRDGDIVDIDGVSPLYFKNASVGSNYAVAVRHRNHIGILSNLSVPISLGLTSTNPNLTTGALNGAASVNYLNNGSVNLLYAGNANFNSNVRYTSFSNDKDYLYINLLGSSAGTVLTNVYHQGDLNMNRVVRYTSFSNDKDYLYINVLNSLVGEVKAQLIQ